MMPQNEIRFPEDIMKKNKNKVAVPVLCTAIVVLGLIQIAAMHYGIDGVFRAFIAFIIAGIVGIHMPKPPYMQ